MKKIIIPIIIVLLVGICIFCYFYLFKDNSKTTITIDINPSIELKLDEDKKVIKVKDLNRDAKDVINNLVGMDYDEAILKIIERVRNSNDFIDDRIIVLVNATGEVNNPQLLDSLNEKVTERNLHADLIAPGEITEEDKTLARKYNITEAKANYLNGILKKYENIKEEDIVYDSMEDLNETNQTGRTCPDGYKLDWEYCIKEKERVKARMDKVCPEGYTGYDNKCYKTGMYTEGDKLTCHSEFKLNGDKCERDEIRFPYGKCPDDGEFRADLMKCKYIEDLGPGVEYCRITPGEDLLYNGRCLGRKPTINGGCLGSDKVINGWCYDTSAKSGYEAEWKCSDGSLKSHADYERDGNTCYKDTYKDYLELYCDEDFTLSNNKCIRHETEDAYKERICESGYTLINNDQCVLKSDSKDLVDGYMCDDMNSKLIGDTCIIYDRIKANSN